MYIGTSVHFLTSRCNPPFKLHVHTSMICIMNIIIFVTIFTIYYNCINYLQCDTFVFIGGHLRVKFGYSSNQEEHDGYFPLQFLKKHSYSPYALQRKQKERKPAITVCLHFAREKFVGSFPTIMYDYYLKMLYLSINVGLYHCEKN